MSTRMLFAPVLLTTLLAGCGLSEEDFTSQSIEISCSKTFECYDSTITDLLPYTTEEDCIAYFTDAADQTEADETCEFDSSKGQECLDAWDAVTCDEMADNSYDISACTDLCSE